ncbi:MAG: glycosyltransferase [Bacteriovoracaceae bacterium]
MEFSHFNIGAKSQFGSPLKLCYFGLFDERSDQNILLAVATKVENCEIHIFGNVVCDISLLSNQKNIIFHGKIAYSELPKLINPIDIFLLPYVRSELTNNINPLKLKEYLATGRPVIATALPEVAKLKEYLYLGNTQEDFVTTVKDLASAKIKYDSQKTVDYIKSKETWASKASFLSELLLQEL